MKHLIELIKKHEGTGPVKNGRFMPYQDSEGCLTIGFGRYIEKKGISAVEAEFMLREDVHAAVHECESFDWFSQLNDPRQVVIVSMVFNLGFAGFKEFKKTIAYLESGDYYRASIEMLDSKWATQVGQRSKELSTMLRTGRWL